MSIATASDFEAAPARPRVTPLMLAAGCVALADWLFYGWEVGFSLALFLAALGIVGVAGKRARTPRSVQVAMAAVFVAGLLALIEAVNAPSVTVAALTTALFVIVITAHEASPWPWQLLEAATIPLRHLREPENWRAMDFRTWRLQRYLANNPEMATRSPDSGKG